MQPFTWQQHQYPENVELPILPWSASRALHMPLGLNKDLQVAGSATAPWTCRGMLRLYYRVCNMLMHEGVQTVIYVRNCPWGGGL
jgi:hypothetical protein